MKIFLIGFMGSGKTHWGKQVSEKLNLPFFDLDDCIVQKEEKTIAEIFAESGEEYFRILERQTLENLVEQNGSMILSCGGGTPCYFNNIKFLKKNGTVVWLNTNIETLVERLIREKQKRPLIKNINDHNLRTFIIKKLNERRMYYEQADLIIDNEDCIPMNQLIQTILHA